MRVHKYFLIAGLLAITAVAKAQQAAPMLAWTPLHASLQPSTAVKNAFFPAKAIIPAQPAPTAYLRAGAPAPDSYYQQCFGYFCKREWELQQKVHVPIKLRLGTYQTAQTQEGK